jgi:hypothetical protein
VAAARAANTLKGYRSDWAEWCSWCTREASTRWPARRRRSPYLVFLAGAGAKVGTMARRLSALRFAFRMRGSRPDPGGPGGGRVGGHPPHPRRPGRPGGAAHAPRAARRPGGLPGTKTWATPGGPPSPTWPAPGTGPCCWSASSGPPALRARGPRLGGRERPPPGPGRHHPPLQDQPGGHRARARGPAHRAQPGPLPGAGLRTWAELAGITSGPVFRPVSTGNKAVARRLSAQTVNYLVQGAIKRAGIDPLPYSAHSLRAGFVTYAHLRGASDRAIAHQTRHRSMATLGQYVRIHEAWQDNAATDATSPGSSRAEWPAQTHEL